MFWIEFNSILCGWCGEAHLTKREFTARAEGEIIYNFVDILGKIFTMFVTKKFNEKSWSHKCTGCTSFYISAKTRLNYIRIRFFDFAHI